MSVVSKALTVAVLATLVSGCATTTTRVGSDSAADAERAVISDRTSSVLDLRLEGEEQTSPTQAGLAATSSPPPPAIEPRSAASMGIETERLLSTGPLSVSIERGADFSRVLIRPKAFSRPRGEPVFKVRNVQAPPRLVLDLPGQKSPRARALNVGQDEFIRAIRVGSHNDKTRLVFDLTGLAADESQVERTVNESAGEVSVTFRRRASTALSSSEQVGEKTELERSSQLAGTGASSEIRLDRLSFTKTPGSPGQVELELTGEAPFELVQDTPTEYILTLPGVIAAERVRIPQISPVGFPGIRSTRVVQQEDGVKVRMFVDAGVGLVAQPKGRSILITSTNAGSIGGLAKNRRARAQVSDGATPPEQPVTRAEASDDAARGNPTRVVSADGSKVYEGRLISLDLQGTEIDMALRIIAEVSNLNIVLSDDVTGKVTLRLINVPWDQALDVILRTNGLDKVEEGNVVRIAPVDKIRQEKEALLQARLAAMNLEELKVNYIRVSYARVADLKEQVESVLSERGSVTVDERTNQIIIKDIKRGQDEALALIKKLDLRTPQVLLETEIVEASRSILRDLGFQWNYSYVASPETGNATGLVFPNSIGIGGSTGGPGTPAVDFPAVIDSGAGSAVTAILDSADGSRQLTARLSALEEEGKVKVISRPQVATINNKQAEIKSVETIRVRLPDSGLSVATGSGATASGGASSAVEEIEVGITLRVTPQASSDYYVLLDVNALSSNFGTQVVDNIPSTIEREATSTILVKSGQTFALGGVYRINDKDTIQGVPWFKDIPVLGALFRRTLIQKNDEELIFFITPHIVEGSFDPAAMM